MTIYGVAILSFCYLVGQIIGELLGKFIGVEANVGGVGFAMILLILINNWLENRNLFNQNSEDGIKFWSQMYIPIIVAMAATQNVKQALSSGLIAILLGLLPVIFCFFAIPILAKFTTKNTH